MNAGKNIRLNAMLFFVWLAFIVMGSIWPSKSSSEQASEGVHFRWDYLLHVAGFMVLSVFYFLWKAKRSGEIQSGTIAIFFLVFIPFAVACEAVQILIASRSFNPVDLALNVTGLIAGFIVIRQILHF